MWSLDYTSLHETFFRKENFANILKKFQLTKFFIRKKTFLQQIGTKCNIMSPLLLKENLTKESKTRIINDFFRMQNTKQTSYFC